MLWFVEGALLPPRLWHCILPPHSLEMELKAGASFLGRLLGIEGSVSPEHKVLMSFSSTGIELDLGEKI